MNPMTTPKALLRTLIQYRLFMYSSLVDFGNKTTPIYTELSPSLLPFLVDNILCLSMYTTAACCTYNV